jgi:putative membrane protein
MEGPQNLKPKPYESSKKSQLTLIIIIVLFHTVGLIGLCMPSLRPIFLQLVPWHILLMLIVVIVSHRPLDYRILLLALLIFITGYGAEWIGVHKNWLFGNYSYGETLGLQFYNIPLIIGVNWFLLVYSSGVLMQQLRIRSVFSRIITGAIVLLLLDLLIEPVAIKLDYWHWTDNIIPLSNYAGWFLLSAIMLFVFEKFNFKKQSMVAPVFLLIQVLFFAVLHFIL